jgi:general stress protein 26
MKLRRALKDFPAFTREQIDEFLKPPLIMRLAVMDARGEPNVTPVWYMWEDGKFYITSQTDKKKFTYVQRNPRVGFCIDVYEPEKLESGGARGVHGKGIARIVGDRVETSRRDRQLIVKYTGSLDNSTAKRLLDTPNVCLIVIEPTDLSSWAI